MSSVGALSRRLQCAAGFIRGCRYLIHDHDTQFSLRFKIVMEAAGIGHIRMPYQAPNANAYAERFVRSIKDECVHRMIFFGKGQLQRALDDFVEHYNRERNHQGIGNELIDGHPSAELGEVRSTDRLGGMLRYYYRAA